MQDLPVAAAEALPVPPPDSELAGEFALVDSGAMPLGDLMQRANRLSQHGAAAASALLYERWIACTDSPLRHVACFNWGTVLGALQRHADAEAAYRQAVVLDPGFVQARLNLGHQIEQQGRYGEALAVWREALALPAMQGVDVVDLKLHALNNLARLSEMERRYDEAEDFMRQSLALKADQSDVIQHYVHIRQKRCEWPTYLPVGEVTLNQLLVGTSPLAMLGASDDPALQLLVARRFVQDKVPAPPAVPLHRSAPPRSGRIKVGYLSGDLKMHAVGLLTPELLELHDRDRFEVYGLCWSIEDGSPLRQRLLAAMDHHVPLAALSDAAAAQRIAQLGIDIVVDLQGITNGARPALLGMRPAPIQVGYLGLPGTSALPGVDWIIADRFVMPLESLAYYTEKPLYLPHCYQVSDRQREIGVLPTRASYGLPANRFVYCSFNNNHKFTQPVFQSWMRILQQVEGSVLWLLADNDWARENMLREADAHQVPRERLIFAPRVAPPDYLARFQLADLFLDTHPYNAGTTASDALWMGTPILTWSGRSYISRMAGSLLSAVGLPDLVTESLADYERLAVQLGRNPLRVASYKRYLAEHGRQSHLFDIPAFVRDLETEFERLALAHRAH